MSEEIRYYKGKHKVRVVNESKGYWTIEALEKFEETVDGTTICVRVGERKIVPSNTVLRFQSVPPPIKEHSYELQMKKKLKRMVSGNKGRKKAKL
jgi:hypothetical protein